MQVIVSTFFLVDEYTSSVKRKKENRAIKFEEPAAIFVRFEVGWSGVWGHDVPTSFQSTAADRINKLRKSIKVNGQSILNCLQSNYASMTMSMSLSVIFYGHCRPNRSEEEQFFSANVCMKLVITFADVTCHAKM